MKYYYDLPKILELWQPLEIQRNERTQQDKDCTYGAKIPFKMNTYPER